MRSDRYTTAAAAYISLVLFSVGAWCFILFDPNHSSLVVLGFKVTLALSVSIRILSPFRLIRSIFWVYLLALAVLFILAFILACDWPPEHMNPSPAVGLRIACGVESLS